MNYRKDIYDCYVSHYQPESRSVLSDTQSSRWAMAYDYYFRNWLPTDMNAIIVDLGCGGGRLLRFFKERRYANLTGVDISPEQIALAKSVTTSVFVKDIFSFLESKHNAFDLLVGIDIIEHLTKDECIQFLKSCYRALKPNGRIILQTPNADSPIFTSTRYDDLTHEVGFTPHCLYNVLKHIGFKSAEFRETGPIPIKYGVKTGLRFFMWKLLRIAIMAWNLIEIGHSGSGVFTRIFLISAVKK